ncbi:chorismate mutase [Streptomyces sp. NPDC101234]|uniref:chorismate mutase n=1 Tax=Streptomyces sp. NPDC101234 TaxID=3366138 RepID=UPI00380CEFB8
MEQQDNVAVDSGIRIDDFREVIDSLDLQIIELIKRRRDLSSQIQQQRIREGGTRTVLSREKIILDRYAAGLGSEGTALALNILSLCRGRIPKAAAEAGGDPRDAA